MTPWPYGIHKIMALWPHDLTAPWPYGTLATWPYGIHKIMALWPHDLTAPWPYGTLATWPYGIHQIMAPWPHDVTAPWPYGTLGYMALWIPPFVKVDTCHHGWCSRGYLRKDSSEISHGIRVTPWCHGTMALLPHGFHSTASSWDACVTLVK